MPPSSQGKGLSTSRNAGHPFRLTAHKGDGAISLRDNDKCDGTWRLKALISIKSIIPWQTCMSHSLFLV